MFKLLNAKCKSLNCCKSKELCTMILSSLQLQEFLPPGSQSCVSWLCLFCEPAWGSKRMHLQSEMHLQEHSECVTHPFFYFKIILLRLQDSCKGPTISCSNDAGYGPCSKARTYEAHHMCALPCIKQILYITPGKINNNNAD